MKPVLLRMREGKPGGGKGPLLSEDISLTLTSIQDVLFQPPTPPSSPVSEDSIWGSSALDGAPSPSQRSSHTLAPNWPSGGPESPTSVTSRPSSPARGPQPRSGQAASLAKTSLTPASEQASTESDPSSPSRSSTLWDSTSLPSSSLRTSWDSSPVISPETWLDSPPKLPTGGMGWRGGYLIAATSECRSADDASSWSVCESLATTLTDVLQPTAPEQYFLSPHAARGILQRAGRRGRSLPPELDQALSSVANEEPTDWQVRRLTPTEGERLMGWPDKWTVVEDWRSSRASARSRTRTTKPGSGQT